MPVFQPNDPFADLNGGLISTLSILNHLKDRAYQRERDTKLDREHEEEKKYARQRQSKMDEWSYQDRLQKEREKQIADRQKEISMQDEGYKPVEAGSVRGPVTLPMPSRDGGMEIPITMQGGAHPADFSRVLQSMSGRSFEAPTEGDRAQVYATKARNKSIADARADQAGLEYSGLGLPPHLQEMLGVGPERRVAPTQYGSIVNAADDAYRTKNPPPQKFEESQMQVPANLAKALDIPEGTVIQRKELLGLYTQANRNRQQAAAAKLRAAGGGASGAAGGDVDSVAQAIIDGKQPPTMTGLYGKTLPVRAALQRKGYDLATAQSDWNATQKHLATLNGAQQERLRQAITFTSDSLENIEELYDKWKKVSPNSRLKIFNRAALAAAKQTGGEAGAAAASLEAQIADLTSELGTVYKGGNGSTDESLKLAAKNLSGDWDEKTFKTALLNIRKNLQIRSNSIKTSQPAGLSTGGQQQAPTYKQTATNKDGHKIGTNDGVAWFDLETGKPVK